MRIYIQSLQRRDGSSLRLRGWWPFSQWHQARILTQFWRRPISNRIGNKLSTTHIASSGTAAHTEPPKVYKIGYYIRLGCSLSLSSNTILTFDILMFELSSGGATIVRLWVPTSAIAHAYLYLQRYNSDQCASSRESYFKRDEEMRWSDPVTVSQVSRSSHAFRSRSSWVISKIRQELKGIGLGKHRPSHERVAKKLVWWAQKHSRIIGHIVWYSNRQ